MQVNNKVIAVTGAGNGMGRELSLLLLAKGARVAGVDINLDNLGETQKLAGEKGKNFSLHQLNISDKESVFALPDEITRVHGCVDGLINNAGIIQPFVRVNDLDFEQINRVMDVNFYGLLYMTKAFLPHLLKRPEAHLVNVSSMGGFLPVPGQSVYGASKAAVKLLTEGLSAELKDTGVKVTVIFPGAVGTNIAQNSGVAAPKMIPEMEKAAAKTLSPVKAAEIMVRGIEKNKTRIFVGKDSRMLDLFYRLSPSFATNLVAKQMKSLLK